MRLGLPRGGTLPEAEWRHRHKWMLRLLWAHVVALPVIAAADGFAPLHVFGIGALLAVFALAGGHQSAGREARTVAVALGLVVSSAILVHEWQATEAHFHFFVTVMALTLYEDWAPLGAALAFVVVQQAVVGVGHGGDPWVWAAANNAFTLAAAAVVVVWWSLTENGRRNAAATEDALRASEHRLLEEQDTLRMVAAVTRAIATKPDARASICAATVDLAGSSFSGLWELQGEDRLVLTACAGIELPLGETIHVGKEASGAAIAFLSGQRFFAPDAQGNPALSKRMVESTGTRSLLFEPVRRGGQVVAVLVLGWGRPITQLSARETSLIALLADEIAVAVERSDMLAQLAALARTDPLTGLANRRVWEEQVPVEIARANRGGEPLSLLVIDLDDFKAINDSQGHQAGDRLLKEVAAAWREVVRPTDLIARFGGDEFVVLLPGCSTATAVQLADRLRAAMPRELTCSVGVVEWSGDDQEQFLERADVALYEAKAEGRNRTAAR